MTFFPYLIINLEKHLHIICLDVPYPVDYGGVFDLFYKLPALHALGIKIHLHCFEYGRGEQQALLEHCESVHYYKRKTGMGGLSVNLPYIVKSRSSAALAERLLMDDYPILMEGVHCTFILNDSRFKERKCFVRLHNVEHIYYRHLYKSTSNFFKKIYYWRESKLLFIYEKAIANKASILTVNEKDGDFFKTEGNKEVKFLPIFLPPWQVNSTEGKGCYCLYHGNLAVSENEEAAKWLIKNVFNHLQIPFVIAGKNPSTSLKKFADTSENICLVANPSETEMQDMIAKAQVHILPSFNATGIKLKMLNALYNGRYCIVNTQAVDGTGLNDTCIIANDPKSFQEAIVAVYDNPYPMEEIDIRKNLLSNLFNNDTNAKMLVKIIWPL